MACRAQMHNVWMMYHGGIDFNANPAQAIFAPSASGSDVNATICDSSGRLQFYTLGEGVYNFKRNGFFTLKTDESYSTNISCVLILPVQGSSSKYYLFHIDSDGYRGGNLYYSIINMAGNNGEGIAEVKNVALFKVKEYINWVTAVKHENKKDYWLVMHALTDTFYAFPVTGTGIGAKIMSVANNIKTPSYPLSYSEILRASFDGKMLVNTFSTSLYNNQNRYIYDEHYSHACSYTFDNKTGLVSNKQVLFKNHLFNINTGDTSIRNFADAAFSPNDSMIYICNGTGDIGNINDKRTNLFQIERFAANPAKTVTVIPYPFPIGSIQTAPDGHIYISSKRRFDIIKYPDRKGKTCTIVPEYVKSNAYTRKFASIFLEIHRLGYIFHPCRDSFSLTPQTDTAYFKEFTWFFPNGDSLTGKTVKYTFGGKSGKYLVKLRGKSKYGAVGWYSDTINYIAPPKAGFVAESKVGCQWVGYQFTNFSVADTFHPVYKQTYQWNFGDGTTDTAKNPLHIFTKPGSYTVSLVYSNGFCSDTFTQQQNVEILSAPKPGFRINDTLGCAPFTIKIKDNSQGEVTKYTYNFGKEFQSEEANPTYIFTKPGIYYISQKLLGPTGCITSDSIKIRVRAGILPDEKPVMLRTTFVNNNQVEISWKNHPLAKYYTLYKQAGNNVPLPIAKHFSDTVYMDRAVSLAEPFHYYITATDSCGSTSLQSLIAQPVILRGENMDNTVFNLAYSPYQHLQSGVKEYAVQYLINADSFVNIINTTGLSAVDSFRFANKNNEQCYRVEAKENAGNNQVSYSNIICLEHLPMFYIPTAFSPNNDEINDYFKISALGIKNAEITIYNRWGEKVYENKIGEEISWDGKFKSVPAAEGIYFYTIQIQQANGKKIYGNGTIHLLR